MKTEIRHKRWQNLEICCDQKMFTLIMCANENYVLNQKLISILNRKIMFEIYQTKNLNHSINRKNQTNWESHWNESNNQFVDVKTKNWRISKLLFKLLNNHMKSNWNVVEISLLMAKTDLPCMMGNIKRKRNKSQPA